MLCFNEGFSSASNQTDSTNEDESLRLVKVKVEYQNLDKADLEIPESSLIKSRSAKNIEIPLL